MTEVTTVEGGDFVGRASYEDGVMTASLAGTADYAALDAVEQVLGEVHAAALRNSITDVRIDLAKLEFMNSSCFKCFVSWIGVLQDLPAGQQYKVTFLSNPRMHWQKRSLHSLQCFAIDLITVVQA